MRYFAIIGMALGLCFLMNAIAAYNEPRSAFARHQRALCRAACR